MESTLHINRHHFYDLSKNNDQYAPDGNAHAIYLHQRLIYEKTLTPNNYTVQKNWRSKKYRCSLDIFITTDLSTSKKIVVDSAVGASGHGRNVIYGLISS